VRARLASRKRAQAQAREALRWVAEATTDFDGFDIDGVQWEAMLCAGLRLAARQR
jgi:hypothetical protein